MSDRAAAMLKRLWLWAKISVALTGIATCAALPLGGARWLARGWVVAEAQAQSRTAVAEVRAEVVANKASCTAAHERMERRFADQDAQTYALYRAVLTRQRQPKLEALGDGGP